jgi:putative ATP-dependent endonuclease of the OLD family
MFSSAKITPENRTFLRRLMRSSNALADLEVVALAPPYRQEIDFYDRNLKPIEITLSFSLEPAERAELLEDVVQEAPQMKNAVADLPTPLQLRASLVITPPARNFGYISSLTLRAPSGAPSEDHPLFAISFEAASELRDNLMSLRKSAQTADQIERAIGRIDASDFAEFRKNTDERRLPLRFLFESAGSSIPRDLYERFDALLRESPSFAEFRTRAYALASAAKEEATAARLKPLTHKLGTFAGEQSAIPEYIVKLLRRLAAIKVLYLTERREAIGKSEATRLLDLKNQRRGTQHFRRIQEAVTSLLGVAIDVFKSDSPARGESEAEIDVDNFLAEVNGSGVREALRIILDVEFQNPAILLVEEPEVYLHPSLEVSMMRYLRRVSTSCQVFLSTHSTNFVDSGAVENVYLVSKGVTDGRVGETTVQSLDLREAEAVIPRELGIRLSSVFMFDRLVFVEGDSQVSMWFLLDRDEKDERDIKKLAERLGGRAKLIVLHKREIENYLLCPRAIAEFIGYKRALGAFGRVVEIPSEAEVQNSLLKHVESLKTFALLKRVSKVVCRPIFSDARRVFGDDGKDADPKAIEQELARMAEDLQKRRGTLENVLRQESESLDSKWQAEKLSIVPGDILLDRVCQDFGVRFKKDLDAGRLAALMNEGEVDTELSRIISEIGEGGL